MTKELTQRDVVIELSKKGYSAREIAKRLCITRWRVRFLRDNTVKMAKSNSFVKGRG